jgi:predicted ATPase with chaperone activity
MQTLFGQKLVTEQVVSEEQLKAALARQQLHGGRLGHNLVTLGHISKEDLSAFFHPHPPPPKNAADTGLDTTFLADLVLKHCTVLGEFSLRQVTQRVKLPAQIVNNILDSLRHDRFLEVKGANGYTKSTYTFSITATGQRRAAELMEICRYLGPAPVLLDEYLRMTERQTIRNIVVDPESLHTAFKDISLGNGLLACLGPAVSSGKAIFLYGPPGNGKTTVAETVGKALPGEVYLPHAIYVEGQIVTLFDGATHVPAPPEKEEEEVDQRWILVHRPIILAGGELRLDMLELEFNPITNFSEAPLQMKANNGMFIIDDFGRQLIEPQNLLNRWIAPLERRQDFLTLHTGLKFAIPFDQLTVFSTNLNPKELVDEAFLRRIRYKIKIDHPSAEVYEAIFKKVCQANEVEFAPEIFDYLKNNYYAKLGIRFNACHPRDLVDQILDNAHYFNYPARLTKKDIDMAWKNYFVEM